MAERNQSIEDRAGSREEDALGERFAPDVDRFWAEYDRTYTACLQLWLDHSCSAVGRTFRKAAFSAAEIKKHDSDPNGFRQSFEALQEARLACLGLFNRLLADSGTAKAVRVKLAAEELLARAEHEEAEKRFSVMADSLKNKNGGLHPEMSEVLLRRDVSLRKLRMVENLRRMAEMGITLEVNSLP